MWRVWILVGVVLTGVLQYLWQVQFHHQPAHPQLTPPLAKRLVPAADKELVILPSGVMSDRISEVDYISDDGYNDETVARLEHSNILLCSRWYNGLYWSVGETVWYLQMNDQFDLMRMDKEEWTVKATFLCPSPTYCYKD